MYYLNDIVNNWQIYSLSTFWSNDCVKILMYSYDFYHQYVSNLSRINNISLLKASYFHNSSFPLYSAYVTWANYSLKYNNYNIMLDITIICLKVYTKLLNSFNFSILFMPISSFILKLRVSFLNFSCSITLGYIAYLFNSA